MNSKPFWKSKTFWANVLVIAVALLKAHGIDGDGATLEGGNVVAIVGLINLVLRAATTQGIHVR